MPGMWRAAAAVLRRTPPNFFAAPFGLTGLGAVWRAAGDGAGAAAVIGDVVAALAAVVWLVLLGGWCSRVAGTPGRLAADLRDPVLGPFVSLIPIVALQLGVALARHAPSVGRVVVDVCIAVIVVLGGWLTGQWIAGEVDQDRVGPAYFLPTLAGGFLASACAAAVGQRGLAELCFGVGVLCWVTLGPLVLWRLVVRPMLPPALVPSLAIEVAPPALAGLAWTALHPAPDTVSLGLAGFGILMIVAQCRLLPVYRSVPFGPGHWSFTFPYCAAVLFALHWITVLDVPGRAVLAAVLVGVTTVFVGAVAAGTVVALRRGRYFPPPAAPPSAAPPVRAQVSPPSARTG